MKRNFLNPSIQVIAKKINYLINGETVNSHRLHVQYCSGFLRRRLNSNVSIRFQDRNRTALASIFHQ